jgi:cell division protease FtsH
VDEEVRKILETSYQEAKRILSENMDAMDVIADFLIKQETITGKEFMKMFNDVRARRDGGQKDLTDQQSEGAAEEAPEAQETPDAQQITAQAAQEEPAAEPAALQMPAEAVQRMSAAQQIPAEAEQAEPAKAAPETPAVPQEKSAEEERRREDDDSRMSPEEVVRKNSAEKGRYSQVSLDDLFGE